MKQNDPAWRGLRRVRNIAERFGTVPSRRTDDAGERLVSCFSQVSP